MAADIYEPNDRQIFCKNIRNKWESAVQSYKDCGLDDYTKNLIDSVYNDMFKYLMFIESTFSEFEECENVFSKYRKCIAVREKLVDNVVDFQEWKKHKRDYMSDTECDALYFKLNKYSHYEIDLYEKIETDMVKPLLSLKESLTYNF